MSNKSPELNDATEQGYFWIKFLTATVTFACLFLGRWIVVRLAALRLALRGIDVVEVPDGDFVQRIARHAARRRNFGGAGRAVGCGPVGRGCADIQARPHSL